MNAVMLTFPRQDRPMFPHPDKWRVFREPPDAPLRVFSYESESAARKGLAGFRRHGHGAHCYLVPPVGGGWMLL